LCSKSAVSKVVADATNGNLSLARFFYSWKVLFHDSNIGI
jgi:hypothetical protein